MILKKIIKSCFALYILACLCGCIAVSVVSTAVGVTTAVVGGAIDVVDAVTPDIIDDDDDDEDKEKQNEDKQ